jgi:hypothetical protein
VRRLRLPPRWSWPATFGSASQQASERCNALASRLVALLTGLIAR